MSSEYVSIYMYDEAIKFIQRFFPCEETAILKFIDPFAIPFDEYVKIDKNGRTEIHIRTLREKENWIEKKIQEKCADWIIVCGGEVVKYSSDTETYPSTEELIEIGKKYNKIPFVFSPPSSIEESSVWNKTVYSDDYYPSLEITVDENSNKIVGDFDTGTKDIFLDLSVHGIDSVDSVDIDALHLQRGTHLGKEYFAYKKQVKISITDESEKTKTINVFSYCVNNWTHSPFCQININRKALIGRSLLLKFQLKVELDGKEKTTKTYL